MKIILWGCTGQSKIIKSIIDHPEHIPFDPIEIVAVFDDTPNLSPPFQNIPLYEGWKDFSKWKSNYKFPLSFVVTIGNPHAKKRIEISRKLITYNLSPISIITPSFILEPYVNLGIGLQIHNHAIVNSYTQIGDYCILNTKSLVEHDCVIGQGVEIGPGAIVCGNVNIGEYTWVGAGAVIKDHITIGKNCIIGAGAVVTKNISDNQIVVGNPAKFLKINTYE